MSQQNQLTGDVMSDTQSDCSACGKHFSSRNTYGSSDPYVEGT